MSAIDRVVHGWMADGTEIVRYDKAGKWYFEPLSDTGRKRRRVTIDEAARAAAMGEPVFGRYGGRVFDARVRALIHTDSATTTTNEGEN